MPQPCHSPTVPCPLWMSAWWPEISELLVLHSADWYASHNNLCGTLRGSRKKPNVGRSPTCCLWTVGANSPMPCHAPMSMPRCVVVLRSRSQNGMVVARHGCSMACVNQTRPYYVNQMGKTQSKPLAARHGRGTAWEWNGTCELALTDVIDLDVVCMYVLCACRWFDVPYYLRFWVQVQ
jgi:hypothetical protein